MHVDDLRYGWWEYTHGKRELPTTFKDRKNVVMTEPELLEFRNLLIEMRTAVNKECEKAINSHRIIYQNNGRKSPWVDDPKLFTLASVLEFEVAMGKLRLKLMQFAVSITQRAKSDNTLGESKCHEPSASGTMLTAPVITQDAAKATGPDPSTGVADCSTTDTGTATNSGTTQP